MDVRLRPEERLITDRCITLQPIVNPLTTREALLLLCDVKNEKDIGTKGPAVASLAFPEHASASDLRLYEVVFGRDSLLISRFFLPMYPSLMRSTIRRLAELQGTKLNNASEEEPGKIVHEARKPTDPIAQRITNQFGWDWPYYGTVDATLLFVIAISLFINIHGSEIIHDTYINRMGESKTILDAYTAAVSWIQRKMDENPQRFIESKRLNTKGGNIIQSWKDSVDSHHHHDGTLANIRDGIASIEVQALAYDALMHAADLYTSEELPLTEDATQLRSRAEQLRQSVFEHLWIDNSFFALGSDRDKQGNVRPLDVRTSNMGHLLHSRILDGEPRMRDKVVEQLLSPTLLTRQGIRTLASNENRYRPRSYHNGSVWPWDTAYIAFGMLEQGYTDEAQGLFDRVLRIIEQTNMFPEFVSGEDTDKAIIPTRVVEIFDSELHVQHAIEQPPQEIQGWTVAAAIAIQHTRKNIAT